MSTEKYWAGGKNSREFTLGSLMGLRSLKSRVFTKIKHDGIGFHKAERHIMVT